MFFKNLKLFLLLFICCIFVQNNNYASAAYDVIKATTISNENEPINEKEDLQESIPTFNDPQLPNFSDEPAITDKIGKKAITFFKRKKKKSEEAVIEDEPVVSNEDTKINPSEYEKIEDSNKFNINADRISYDETDGNIYANGNVEIIANVQKIKLKADEAVLDKDNQTLKMSKNVKIIKDGSEINGEYRNPNNKEQFNALIVSLTQIIHKLAEIDWEDIR